MSHRDKPANFPRDFGVDELSVHFGLESHCSKMSQGPSAAVVHRTLQGLSIAVKKHHKVKISPYIRLFIV